MLNSWGFCVLLLSLITPHGQSASCAVGWVPKDQGCVCGVKDGFPFGGHVICGTDGNSSRLRSVVICLTMDNQNKSLIVAGACRPLTAALEPDILNFTVYFELPSTAEALNRKWCSPLNRTGTLCGQCMNGTVINIHSVTYQCIPDTDCDKQGWMWYIMGEIGPLTLMLIVVVVFQPAFVTPSWNAFILFAQTVSLPNKLAGVNIGFSAAFNKPLTWPQCIFQGVYGIFNLQISWLFFPTLCIGPTNRYDILTVLSLQYVTALYPLAFCVLMYLCFELYHSNCRPFVCLCRPVLKCLARCRRCFKLSSSPLDSFATLFLLSFIKITNVSIFLLLAVPLYDISGTVTNYVLYYDGSVIAFGRHHWPYAILALVMLTLFTITPTVILFVYYSKPLRRILYKYGFYSKVLNTFVDIYQAGYKDGTGGGRDCRFFAALYFIFRVLFTLFMAMVDINIMFAFMSILVSIAILNLFLIFRPYKKMVHNILDGLFFSYTTTVTTLYAYCEVILSFMFSMESYRYAVLSVNLLLLFPAIFQVIFLLALVCHHHKMPSKFWSKLIGQSKESNGFESGSSYMQFRESDQVLLSID